MAFDIDIGFATLAGRKEVNEDFCAAMLPEPGQQGMGSIVAIADGVSTGGMGREAAQTTVTSLVRDYYGTPETWDTTVALDRIIGAQNAWLAGLNRRRHPALGLTTLTALVLRGQSYALAHVGDTRAYLLREGRMTQLTTDHVMDHPDLRHQLLRCVGAEDRLVMDYTPKHMMSTVFGFGGMCAAIGGMFMTQIVGHILTVTNNNYTVLFTLIPAMYFIALTWMYFMAPRKIPTVDV